MAIDISTLVQENYGISVSKCINTRDGWIIEEEQNKQILLCRQSTLRGEKILGTHIILKHLNENGFVKTDKFINTINKLPYVPTNQANYILLKRPSGAECNIENMNDVAKAARLLGEMHLAAQGFNAVMAEEYVARRISNNGGGPEAGSSDNKEEPTPEAALTGGFGTEPSGGLGQSCETAAQAPCEHGEAAEGCEPFNLNCYIKNDLGKTQEIFNKRFEELKKFKKQAKKNNNAFDYAYLEVADYYCDLAGKLCEELQNSPYEAITENYKALGCICHRDYTGHNILLGETDGILNFENACIDLPIYDVANFLRRRMRKCGWSANDAYLILDNYSKTKPLTNDEITVLKLLLQYPQKLWRIVNKYYNSRRSWCEKSCLAKLAEVVQEKEPLEEFARIF